MKIIWQRYSIGWWWHVELLSVAGPCMTITRGMPTTKQCFVGLTVGVWEEEPAILDRMLHATRRQRTLHHIDALARHMGGDPEYRDEVLQPARAWNEWASHPRGWFQPFTEQDVATLRDAVRRECGPEVAARIHM